MSKPASNTPLSGQIAVVTGAGKGIGAAIASRLAELGAQVVLCGRTEQALEARAASIRGNGGRAAIAQCDVCELDSVEKTASSIAHDFGKVNILVNNAGIGAMGVPLHETAPEVWERVINTNLRGVYYCIRSFAPLMIENQGGHIINISSLAGKNALPNGAAYAASKWGLNGLSYSAAEELRRYGIRVSVICPGSTHTEFSPHAGMNTERMLQPADVAHVVAMIVTQAPQSFVSEVLLRPTQKP